MLCLGRELGDAVIGYRTGGTSANDYLMPWERIGALSAVFRRLGLPHESAPAQLGEWATEDDRVFSQVRW
jgi:hypothetical protein